MAISVIPDPASQRNRRLQPGLRLANQAIRDFVGHDPIGDRYSALFGTTSRMYSVNVSFGGPYEPSMEEYEDILSRSSALRHPCLVQYFACGDNDGVIWLRSEHSYGVPAWITETMKSDKSPDAKPGEMLDDDGNRCFPTLRSLFDSCGGSIAASDRETMIGDLAETLAFLHSNGSYAGELTPDTILLDRTVRHSGLIARLRLYGWPGVTSPALVERDIIQAGEIIEMLEGGSGRGFGTNAHKDLLQLANVLRTPGTGGTGVDFLKAFNAIMVNAGRPRALRQADKPAGQKPASARSPAEVAGSQPQASRTSRPGIIRRRHYTVAAKNSIFNMTSETGMKVVSAIRMMPGPQAKPLVDRYTPEQLEYAASLGEPVAAARLCAMRVLASPADFEVRKAANAMLAPLRDGIIYHSQDNPSAAHWYACNIMLGVFGRPDYPEAVRLLERASAEGYGEASLLLGDWFATYKATPVAEDDRKALGCWIKAAADSPSDHGLQARVGQRVIKFVRDGRGVGEGYSEPVDFVRSMATMRNPEAMLLMSEIYDQGRYVEPSPSTALALLRDLASNATVQPVLRAEAQRRMAEMYAVGRGSSVSDTAARTWFERSAQLGNAKAMTAMAKFAETGKGLANGEPNPEAARAWREKAAKAQQRAEPEKELFTFMTAVRISAAAVRVHGGQQNPKSAGNSGPASSRSR